MSVGRRIEIHGTVQGVGFRPWVYRLARDAGVVGRVRNDAAGVTIEAFGEGGPLDAFLAGLHGEPPPAAEIRSLLATLIDAEPPPTFEIDLSASATTRAVSIPADLSTCDACVAEVRDPHDRRYRYPFTNCTDCGPRFTIVRDVPYDRPATSMAAFRMCPECQREYDSVGDRRFHAQPNACPRCGPRLQLWAADGEVAAGDPLRAAGGLLRRGLIVAVKGLGGFHLACDARSEGAVSRLRARKRRTAKPFAVMAHDLEVARCLGRIGPAEADLLTSRQRPIVLCHRRSGSGLADAVAPGNPLVGLLLPYTPLHHLLLDEARGPLVMTSGNLSDEPLVRDEREALTRLGDVADAFLVHDREIVTRCDDSVARIVDGSPTLLRRARGWVPRPVPAPRPFARPVLALGGQLKNTVCVGVGDSLYLGPHVGDLDNLETFEAFEQAVGHMLRLLDVEPRILAHDLHPDYVSTRYARDLAVPATWGVQHHHAHVAACLAEHGLEGPAIGVAYDGTGYGPDGTAWGGEILLADLRGYRRLASFRPLPLAGGDTAIREVWRIALALLLDAGLEDALPRLALFQEIEPARVAVVTRMLSTGLNAPGARGVGRVFDAFGAIGLARALSEHEGQVAMEWNFVADPDEGLAYPYAHGREREHALVDLRPTVAAFVGDLLAGDAPALLSARFHNTLVAATVERVRDAVREVGRLPVVLTGGCFQNDLLAERTAAALRPELEVLLHGEVPPGDGGLALGQAVVAGGLAGGE
jgi:hydrogenase maturation protein HypF